MEKIIDLFDLLNHQVKDLFSAEEQIIEGLPAMIGNARNPKLVKALKEHLKITKSQLTRLKEVQKLLNKENTTTDKLGEKSGGFFSRLFGSADKCKAMEGLITEGEKMMSENMTPDVLDAAIIGCAQKIEHYEIAGYGTARAYANELRLAKVEGLLKQTLDEEYFADDILTKLAIEKINSLAENHGAQKPGELAKSQQGKNSANRTSAAEGKTNNVRASKRTSRASDNKSGNSGDREKSASGKTGITKSGGSAKSAAPQKRK